MKDVTIARHIQIGTLKCVFDQYSDPVINEITGKGKDTFQIRKATWNYMLVFKIVTQNRTFLNHLDRTNRNKYFLICGLPY